MGIGFFTWRAPGLSWRARTERQMALTEAPARPNNKVFVVIRQQYVPIFATAHAALRYDCGGGFPQLLGIYLLGFI